MDPMEQFKSGIVTQAIEVFPEMAKILGYDFEDGWILRKMGVGEIIKDSIDEAKREVAAVISTETKDRDKDIIIQSGWHLKNFRKTPSVLFGHNHYIPLIGKSVKIGVEGKKLISVTKFATHEFAEQIFRLYVEDFMRAWSVGFRPMKAEWLDDEKPWDGRKFLEQELLEHSAVNVGSNPEALTNALKEKVINEATFKTLIQIGKPSSLIRCVDDLCFREGENKTYFKREGGGFILTEEQVKELFGADDPTLTVEEIIAARNSIRGYEDEKRVVPFSLTPTMELGEPWKVSQAMKSLREWAGFPDTGDFKKYSKGFAFVEDPEDDLESYHLMHHQVIDGELKVIWRGVVKAMGEFLRGKIDAPEGDRKGIYNHLKKHYEQFDREPPDFKSSPEEFTIHTMLQEIDHMKKSILDSVTWTNVQFRDESGDNKESHLSEIMKDLGEKTQSLSDKVSSSDQ